MGPLAPRIPLSSQQAFRWHRNAGENMGADYLPPDTVQLEIDSPDQRQQFLPVLPGQLHWRCMTTSAHAARIDHATNY
jgi:hypothetical protein